MSIKIGFNSSISIFFRSLVFTVVALGCVNPAIAKSSGEEFSFYIVGDSRPELYVAGGLKQKAEINTIVQQTYGPIPDENLTFTFDPDTQELAKVKINIPKHKVDRLLTYKNGWPQNYISDGRSIYRVVGREWVFDRIASGINRKDATFVIHDGDIPLNGFLGRSFNDSPYWQLFDKELLSRLPRTDKNDFYGKVFAAAGNHETWEDEHLEGLFTTMPWLKDFGFTPERRIYSFTYKNSLFIFLDSGGGNASDHEGDTWTSISPVFAEQMQYLEKELQRAKAKKIDHVFVTYHKPSFCQVQHDPLPANQNPHDYLKKYSNDLDIYVFNGHSHTTEHYFVDNINYFVLGGGGSSQSYTKTGNPSPQQELYWKGEPRVEEYNFMKITVNGKKITGDIHRFRPEETQTPVRKVEVFSR